MSSTQSDWENLLKGKKFVEAGTESADANTFTSQSLPQPSRVVRSGDMMTMQFVAERLNVHLDDNDVCTRVTMG